MIVIGIEFKEGVFNDKPWRKAYVYCAEDIPVDKGEGQRSKYFKCKPELVENVDLGDKIKVYYNEYNNVEFIQVL